MRGRGARTVVVGVLFAILSFFSRHGRRNKCQPRWVSSIRTHPSIFPALCSTAQFNFLYPIPSHLSGATSLSAEGTLTQPPPSSSLSRHCCCEDEMSVLLKVPLKHNSDLWCLIVSFQSCERGRETHSHSERLFESSDNRRIIQRGPADNFSTACYNSNRNFTSAD